MSRIIRITNAKKIFSNQKGLSGVEFVISIVIISLIVVVLYDILRETTNTYKYQDVQTDIVQQARTAMEKMAREIRQANVSTIVITVLDPNRDRIDFSAPLELENPDDLQTIRYEPQLDGTLVRTVTYAVGVSETNVVASYVKKLYFNSEYEGAIAIRMQVVNSSQTVNLPTKVFPRNKPQAQ
jgi:type II secretory pathway pseudopilin PulG